MSRATLVLLLMVAAAAGAVGYVVGSGDSAPTLPDTGPERARPPRPEPRDADTPPITEAQRHDIRRVLEAVPTPEYSTGRGVITGRVTTPEGVGVEGALVRADRNRLSRGIYRRGMGPPEGSDGESRLKEFAERVNFETANRREAITGEDGGFSLSALAEDATYRIQAWKRGYQIQPHPYASRYRAGAKVTLHARPMAIVPVEVRLPGGRPAERAVIEVRLGSGTRSQTWTPDLPEMGFEPGTHRVRAIGGDIGELASEEREIGIDLANPPASIMFQLEDRPGISGKVTFPEGQEYAYGEIVALRILPGKERDPQRLVAEGHRKQVYTSMRGEYVFLDLPPGRYLLGFVMNRRNVVASAEVEVVGGMEKQDLAAPPPDPAESVVLRIVGPDGKPAVVGYLSTGYSGPKGSGSGTGRYTRFPDGTLRVAHSPVEAEHEDPALEYWISVRSNRYGTKKTTYKRSQASELTIRFEAPASLDVTLSGYLETEYEGAVTLTLSAGTAGGSGYIYRNHTQRNLLTADGKQKFGPLQPGDYTLSVALAEESYRSRTVASVVLTLKAGANRETVPLPTLYSLTVLLDAKDGTTVSAQRMTRGSYATSRTRVKEGRAVIQRLAAGDYTVSAGSRQMRVKIPDQREVRLEAQTINAYRVSITDPKGNMAQAGLKDGDILIGIDDTEFGNSSQMWAAVTLARTKDRVTLTILRGNVRRQLAVNMKQIYGTPLSGGHLQPTHR